MNKVILMGRLTQDVELRYTQSAEIMAVSRFVMAVSRKYKKKDSKEADTDFIRCVSFGTLAENISRYFQKGRMIMVTGRMQCGNYKNNEGKTIYTTDIVVDEFEFTGEKKQDGSKDEYENAKKSLDKEKNPFDEKT